MRGAEDNRIRGGWSFFCPLEHRKKNASAAIWVNDEGWISVHCFDCRRNEELREVLVIPHLHNGEGGLGALVFEQTGVSPRP